MRRRMIAGTGAAAALLLAACGGRSTVEAEVELCDELGELRQVLASTRPITAATPVEEVRGSRDRLRDAMEDVTEVAEALGEARVADVRNAYQRLDGAVRAVPGDTTMGRAAAAVQPYVDEVERARASLHDVRCAAASGSPATPARGPVARIAAT